MAQASTGEILAEFRKDPSKLDLFTQLRDKLQTEGRWQELLEVYEKAAQQSEARRAEELLFEGAAAAETRAQDLDRAAALYEQSFLSRKKNLRAIRALRALEESRENWSGVLRAHRLHLEGALDKARRARVFLELGIVYEEKLREPDRALESYRQALDEDANTREAINRADTICRNKGRWRTLTRLYKSLAMRLKGRKEASLYHYRAGLILADQLKDARNASVAFKFCIKAGLTDATQLERIISFSAEVNNRNLNSLALKRAISLAPEPPDKARAQARLALHYLEREDDDDAVSKARTQAEEALEIDPQCREALDALSSSYQREDPGAEAWVKLNEHRLAKLDLAREERVPILVELGDQREKLGRLDEAEAAFRGALAADAEQVDALRGLERIARSQGSWEEYEQLLRQQLDRYDPQARPDERPKALDILRKLARLYRELQSSPRREIETLREILNLDPADNEALERIAAISDELGDHEEHARILKRQAELARDPGPRSSLYRRLAELRETRLNDLGGAAAAWEFVDRYAHKRGQALEALERIYELRGEHRQLASIYRRQAEVARDPRRRARILRRLGTLLREKLDAPREAARVLHDAWSLAPNDPRSISILYELLEYARESGQAKERLDVLRELTTHEQDRKKLREVRLETARTRQELGKDAEALEDLGQILAERPAHPEALDLLVSILLKLGRHAEAATRLSAAFDSSQDADRLALGRQLARLYEKELDKPDEALSVWRRVVATAPEEQSAIEEMLRLARASKSDKDLEAALRALITILPTEKQPPALLELARRYRDRDEFDQALSHYRRAHDADPDDVTILDELRSLLARRKRFRVLLDVLERAAGRIKAIPDAAVRERSAERLKSLTLSASEVAEVNLEDRDRAIALLEGLRETFVDQDILERLAELYRRSDRTRDLEKTLGALARLATNSSDRLLVLQERAQVAETTLTDPMLALSNYDEALELEPKNSELLVARAAVYERLGTWAKAEEDLSLASQAKKIKGAALAAIERRRGRLLDAFLDRAEDAEQAFKRAVRNEPSDFENHSALVAYYDRRNRYEPLQEALQAAADHAPKNAERIRLLRRRSELLARFLGRLDEALAAAEEALRYGPENLKSLNLKIRLLRRARRQKELAAALAGRRAMAPEPGPEERTGLLREEGLIRAEGLGQVEEGRALLQAALELAPQDLELLEDLLRVERQLEQPERLLSLLSRAAELCQRESRRARFLTEAGRVSRERLGDDERATRFFAAALEADARNFEALHGLQSIAEERRDDAALSAALERELDVTVDPIARQNLLLRIGEARRRRGDEVGAREVLEVAARTESIKALRALYEVLELGEDSRALLKVGLRLAADETDPGRRRHLRGRLGERLEALLAKDFACQAYRASLEEDGADLNALRGLGRLLAPGRETDELIQVLESELGARPDPARAGALELRLGELKSRFKEDPAGAAAHFRKAIEFDPGQRRAWDLLRRCAMELEDYPTLARLYEDTAERSPRTTDKEQAFRQAALLHHHHLNDLAKAKELYFKVLELGDPEVVAIEALPAIVEDIGSRDEKRRLMGLTAQIVPGSTKARQALIELARERLKASDDAAARDFLTRALDWSPRDEEAFARARLSREEGEALELLLDIERRCERWSDLCAYLEVKGRLAPLANARCFALLERGAVLRDELAQEPEAIEAFAAVFAIDPCEELAIKNLRKLYAKLEQTDALADLLTRAVEHAEDEPRKVEYLLGLSEVEGTRGDGEAALDALERAVALRPTDPELLDGLAALQRERGEFAGLARSLEARAELETGAPRRGYLAEKAEVHAEQLGETQAACDLLEACLDELPPRKTEEATALVARLQALADREGDEARGLRAYERELGWIIEEEDAARISDEDAARLEELALEVARRTRERGDLPLAESWLERALVVQPRSRPLFLALRQVIEDSQRRRRLVQALERRCGYCDQDEEAELRAEVAELYAGELKKPAQALDNWRRVLELDPRSFAGLRSGQRLAWDLGLPELSLELCEGEIESLDRFGPMPYRKPAEGPKPVTAEDAARLEERLREAFTARGARAERYDLRALVIDVVGYQQEDLEGLVKIFVGEAKPADGPVGFAKFGDYVSRAYRRAALLARDLDRLDDCIRFLERALSLVPEDDGVHLHLAEVLEHKKDWERLNNLLRERWTRSSEVRERSALGLHIARVEAERGDTAAAIAVLESVWEDSQGEVAVLDQLARLQRDADESEGLARTLRWRANLERGGAAECALRLERARLLSGALKRPDDALEEYRAILALEPASPEAAEEAAAILESLERREELLELRRSVAGATRDSERKATLLRQAARLARALERREEALSLWEEALPFDPKEPEALASLTELYREGGNEAALLAVLIRRADEAEGEAASPLLEEAVAIEKKRSPERALALLERLIAEGGESRGRAEALVEIREILNQPEPLMEALEGLCRLSEDEKERHALYRRCAEVAQESGARKKAIEYLEGALKEDPEDRESALTLTELYEDDPLQRLDALEWVLAFDLEPAKVEELTLVAADLATRIVYDPNRAIPAFRRLLKLNPRHELALEGLITILEREQRTEDLLQLLRREIELLSAVAEEGQRVIGLRLRLARVLEETVFDVEEAFRVYRGLFAEAEASADWPWDREDFLDRYEAFLRRRGRFEELLEVLEIRAEAEQDAAAAGRLWRDQARLREGKLRDDAGALRCYERALALDPQDGASLTAVQRPLRRFREWERLAAVLEQATPLEQDLEQRAWLTYERGVVLEEELKDQAGALAAYEAALSIDGLHLGSIRRLRRLYEEERRFEDLARVLKHEVKASHDSVRRAAALCRIGDVSFRELARAEEAEAAFVEAVQQNPRSIEALEGLIAVRRSREDWSGLAESLSAFAVLTKEPEGRLACLRERAELLEVRLRQSREAGDEWARVVNEAPDDLDAVEGLLRCRRASADWVAFVECVGQRMASRPDVIGGRAYPWLVEASQACELLAKSGDQDQLEEALDYAQAAFALAPERPEAIERIRQLSDPLSERKAFVKALLRHAALVGDKEQAVQLLREAGQVSLEIGYAEAAEKAFRQLLERRPWDSESIRSLERLAREAGELEKASSLVDAQLVRAEPGERGALLRRAGEIRLALSDQRGAAAAYQRALFESDNREESLDLLSSLLPILRELDSPEDLARALKRGIAHESPQRLSWMAERAELLAERLNRRDLACRLYEELLASGLEPALHHDVFRKLTALLSELGRFRELREALRREAEIRGKDGAPLWTRLGELAETSLSNPVEAVACFRRSLALQPGKLPTLTRLREALVSLKRWDEALQVIDEESKLQPEASELVALNQLAGQISEDKLGDHSRAAGYFKAASLLSQDEAAPLEDLARVQERRGNFGELAQSLERLIEVEPKAERRVTRAKQLGAVYTRDLKRPERAVGTYQRALKDAPEDLELLEALSEAYESTGAYDELATVLQSRLGLEEDEAPRLALYRRLAAVWSQHLASPEQALVKAIEPALALASDSAELLAEKAALLRELGRWEDLIATLTEIKASAEGAERLAQMRAIAEVYQDRLGERGRAVEALEESLSSPSLDEDFMAYACELYRAAGAWSPLSETLRRRAEASPQPSMQAAYLAEVGVIESEELEDPAKAEESFLEALRRDGEQLQALWGLVELKAEDPEQEDERFDLLKRIAELEPDSTRRVRAWVEVGQLTRERFEDYDAAQEAFRSALKDDPACFAAIAGMAELLTAQERWKEALPFFQRMQHCPDFREEPEYAADLLHDFGRVCLELDDREEAVACFQRALELQPEHFNALEDLGGVLIEIEAWSAAIKVLEKLIVKTRVPVARAQHELALARAHREVGDLEPAQELLERVLKRFPDRLEALEDLAALQIQRGDVDGAQASYDRLMSNPSAEPEICGRALVAIADLSLRRFRDPAKAAGLLHKALEYEGDHRAGAARRRAEILGRAEQWPEAARELSRAIEFESDSSERALLWSHLGRLSRDRLNNLEYARRCFETALELNPTEQKTLDSLLRLLESTQDFEAMDTLLGDAIARAEDGLAEIPYRLQRGELFRQARRPAEAVSEFQYVLGLAPENLEARNALGRLYVEMGDATRALAFHNEALDKDPFAVASYRAMAEVYRGTQQADAFTQALNSVVVLRAHSPDEASFIERANQVLAPPLRPVSVELFLNNVVHPQVPGSLGGILQLAAGWVPYLFPVDLKPYGLKRRNRVDVNGELFPEQRLLRHVVQLFGLRDKLDIYWMPDWRRPKLILEPTTKPTLILCPPVFEGLNEREKLFLLGRAVGPILGGAAFVPKVGASGLFNFIAFVAQAVDPQLRRSEDLPPGFNAAVRKLGREAKSQTARRVIPLARELWRRRQSIDFGQACQAYELTASRCGLIAAGGSVAAIECLYQTQIAPGSRLKTQPEDVLKQLQDKPQAAEILRYSISDDYLDLRKDIGLSKDQRRGSER